MIGDIRARIERTKEIARRTKIAVAECQRLVAKCKASLAIRCPLCEACTQQERLGPIAGTTLTLCRCRCCDEFYAADLA